MEFVSSLRSRAQPIADEVRARIPDARGKLLRPLVRFREMRFPTFAAAIHESIACSDDYFRYATLGLALQRVLNEEIPGALAEVGVWRGQTSVFLHALAPDRRLYLFDTFSGFQERDLPPGRVDLRFRDANLDAVRRRVGSSPNVLLRPGNVPEVLQDVVAERFAFVLLDLDLFDPTRSSLEFFYPRMSPGGYLIVHDYNNEESGWACKRALDGFLVGKPERLVELGDVWGSALIRRAA
jgi:O-methyltransferase